MPPATTAEAATGAAQAFAPAKLNLSLHVTGRRADGYHLLDSLVAFAGIGDSVTVSRAEADTLAVIGPMAPGVPTGADNLVARAVRVFDPGFPVAVTLTKRLPAAAGIGGGSSDAAACLRALADLTGRPVPPPEAVLSLGADVPVCLAARPARMRGIGERVDPVGALPEMSVVLVNPGVAVPTGKVFSTLRRAKNPPMPERLQHWADAQEFALWLGAQRNDLEPPARDLAPDVDAALKALAATSGCLLARMSGSGATCFGLYADSAQASGAARRISDAQPAWWVAAARLLK